MGIRWAIFATNGILACDLSVSAKEYSYPSSKFSGIAKELLKLIWLQVNSLHCKFRYNCLIILLFGLRHHSGHSWLTSLPNLHTHIFPYLVIIAFFDPFFFLKKSVNSCDEPVEHNRKVYFVTATCFSCLSWIHNEGYPI